ncbi:bifunctional 3'-5' exonuclease/DNA polymerase [Arthrobacter sp. APC 3897]|uniref:bifunctional 3'-5' exonuclease/DNA polymerase n=1 Tax=Arthrobacter sp. APC 3897 TaxID=3035204 RepID=UPI0025B5D4C8|nr:bifunctional 3'-5' exonuclease/DNA polymerase [Arthrobacter sp. APC 3897]MDN3482633.1 bifunctional 3'-5' exonuclease/DNA polymerase [Arthrobacter sp. APC 3897]
MHVVLTAAGPGEAAGSLLLQETDDAGRPGAAPAVVVPAQLAAAVRHYEDRPQNVRWVFGSTRDIYPRLLEAGITVERSHDLALVRGILRFSEAVPPSPYLEKLRTESAGEDADQLPRQLLPVQAAPNQSSLFEEFEGFDPLAGKRGPSLEDQVSELQDQLAAVAGSASPRRLTLLLAAESAGGLIAVEMEHAGLPWRRDIHEAMLETELGPRPPEGQRPLRLEQLAAELRDKLGNPGFNPDSPQELLRALHRAGIEVKTTRSWELQQHEHPAIAPLLEYKRLSRLLSANGWTWLDAWVDGGRFRPEYVVGGVVSGRWASRGGGALQIPKYVRDAVRPDPGFRLIVADAAQLEPRVLAALGRDNALAAAARGKDLYQGIADQNFNGDRALAKMAMLGAMYGATSGEAGRLMPALTRSYPQAIDVVERGARAGESGKVVSSHLGRSSPPVSERWLRAQQTASAEEQRRADNLARSQGRFTRNFVVQSTAAEWALCWLAEIRRRLRAASGSSPAGQLVFFLHDEVMLHVPADRAEEVSALVTDAAAAATRLLFGRIPLEFPVVAVTVDSYAEAK